MSWTETAARLTEYGILGLLVIPGLVWYAWELRAELKAARELIKELQEARLADHQRLIPVIEANTTIGKEQAESTRQRAIATDAQAQVIQRLLDWLKWEEGTIGRKVPPRKGSGE